MKTVSSLTDAEDVLAYYVTGAIDVANFEIAALTKVLREERCSMRAMEAIENAKRGYMKIKRDGYLVSDFKAERRDLGYYNMRDFLTGICMGINNYLSGIFDVDIVYRITDEDSVNLVFDATLVEKAIYDGVFGLLCEAGVKNRRVSVYAKDLSKHIKISMRCEGAGRKDGITIRDRDILFMQYGKEGQGSYAEIAMEKLGGMYKSLYGKNDAKIELYIPKNLRLPQLCMKEEEVAVRLGERVMVHKPCGKLALDAVFKALKLR